jgi:hypothetical protein
MVSSFLLFLKKKKTKIKAVNSVRTSQRGKTKRLPQYLLLIRLVVLALKNKLNLLQRSLVEMMKK